MRNSTHHTCEIQKQNDVCQAGRVTVNGKPAKPSVKLKVGDIVCILFGSGEVKFKVTALPETVRKDEAASMYELLE